MCHMGFQIGSRELKFWHNFRIDLAPYQPYVRVRGEVCSKVTPKFPQKLMVKRTKICSRIPKIMALRVNPRLPEAFFVSHLPKGGGYHTLPRFSL